MMGWIRSLVASRLIEREEPTREVYDVLARIVWEAQAGDIVKYPGHSSGFIRLHYYVRERKDKLLSDLKSFGGTDPNGYDLSDLY